MRIVLFALGILVIGAGVGSRAEAESYPWCAVYDTGDATYNCGFVSFDQCMTTVRGIGGMCTPNTLYQPSGPRQRTPWQAPSR
jgi:Protein of unknown function (DUF3551)